MRSITMLLYLACLCAILPAQPLQYEIRPENTPEGGKLKLRVTLEFYPSRTDTTRFGLPTQINWSAGLHRCFRNFKAEGGRVVREDSTHLVVVSRGDGPVRLQYDILQHFPGEQVTVETSCSPIILPDYIHLPGECLFLVPRHYQLYEVTVRWTGLPKRWALQNSFGSGELEQKFQSVTSDWLRTIWVAGDFRILKGEALGKPFAFAIRGQWLFDDRTLFDIAEKTIETQRREWEDEDIPFYSVTMIPFVLPKGGRVVGNARTGRCLGYGRYQSFVVYASDDCPLDPLIHLFNHEMMHDWIGGKINTGSPGETASLRWFDEGFSEYYALRNRWRAGFSTTAEFLDALNREFLASHYADPHGETPNLIVERDFYTNPDYENVPYRRGCILALYLDCAIRQKTGNTQTLHHFMLDLLDYTYGKRRDLLEHFDFFHETLGAYIGEAAAGTFLTQYVDAGKRIAPGDFPAPDFLEFESVNGAPHLRIKAGREADFRR
ncbi:MAG: hypothetical protein IPM81_15080 [Saprospirales bacterium]|nr:hypothetical protein [Saprospirales bacterium]